MGLYALWFHLGAIGRTRVDGALARGQDLREIERALGLRSEAGVQGLFIGHDRLVELLHGSHHRFHSRRWSPSCSGSLPAPPRPLPRLAHVAGPAHARLRRDPARADGSSAPLPRARHPRHGPALRRLGLRSAPGPRPRRLAAFPSVHVAWAVLIGWAAYCVSASRRRWLAVAHAAMTTLVVLATGNQLVAPGHRRARHPARHPCGGAAGAEPGGAAAVGPSAARGRTRRGACEHRPPESRRGAD